MNKNIGLGIAFGICTSLHNAFTAYKLLTETENLYLAGLAALSAAICLAGIVMAVYMKKSAAYLIIAAALVCFVQKAAGLEGDYLFWWMGLYAVSSVFIFNTLNIVVNVDTHYHGSSVWGMIETVKECMEKADELKQQQSEWIHKIDAYIKKYGLFTYYGYLFAVIFSLTMPLMYLYMKHNNSPTDDILSRSLVWGAGISVLVFLINEAQRKRIKENDTVIQSK